MYYGLSRRISFNPRLGLYIAILLLSLTLAAVLGDIVAQEAIPRTPIIVGKTGLMGEVLKGVWLLYIPFVVLMVYGVVTFMHDQFRSVPKVGRLSGVKVIFQIASLGFNRYALTMSVRSVVELAGKYIDDYEVWIVVEEKAIRDGFFSGFAGSSSSRVKVVYVPEGYVTRKGTRYKARALNYALEARVKSGLIGRNVWVFLMDEESIVGEDTIIGIVDFIRRSRYTNELLGQGLVVYANKWCYSSLTSAGEGFRPIWELGLEYASLKLFGRKLAWKGSNLLVRSDLEAAITWDFGVLGDDLAFGLIAQHRKTRVGWLWGFLYEQSPFTLSDNLRQKIRWYENILDIALRLKGLSLYWRALLIVELATWHASLFGLFLWPFVSRLDTLYLTLLTVILANSAYGVYLNSHFAGATRRSIAVKMLATPLALLIVAVAPWLGAAKYVYDIVSGENHGFHVVRK